MSDATLYDPGVRAEANRWYLYYSDDPVYGPDGRVRAVIEEVCDEMWSGDGGPTRARRIVYLGAEEIRDSPRPPQVMNAPATFDGLDEQIENEMTDDEFQRLIEEGIIVPISASATRSS